MTNSESPNNGGARPALLRGAAGVISAVRVTMQVVCVVAVLVLAVTLLVGVVYRYVLAASFPYSAALTPILFPWLAMAGAVLSAIRGDHLAVEYFSDKLPERLRHAVFLAGRLLLIVMFVWLTFVAVELLPVQRRQTTPLLGWSAIWGFYSIPVGFAGLAIAAAAETVRAVLVPGSPLHDPETGSERTDES